MGSKSHIFPRGLSLRTEHVVATVKGDYLQVILPTSNFHRGKLTQLGGECYEAFIPIAGGEDTTLEGFVGFFIDECTNLHPAACCKLEQAARFDNCCHTKIQEENNFGFTGGGISPMKWGWGECLDIISPSPQYTKFFKKKSKKKFKKKKKIKKNLKNFQKKK